MVGELIKEYLVGLGVRIDKPGFKEMESTINQTSSTIASAAGSWSKNFVTASGIIATAIAGVTASIAGLMTAAAKQDLAMEKYARNMLVSKGAALEMKAAIDALGESVQDIQITPELYNRYKALVGDGRKMKVGGDYEGTMKDFRDLVFEFTRLKQEASYAMQWVGYYLMKHLSRPLAEAKSSFKSLNDSVIKNMPVWTEKVARALVYIINVGRHFWDLLKSIGKALYDVWDAFPRGIKIATAALAAFFVVLRASPLGRMIALVSSLLLLADDYFGYMEGKQAAMGPLWDKLNGYIDAGKQKFSEWGKELAPVWDKFIGYLVAAKDNAIELGRQCMDWFEEIGQSKAINDFLGTAKRLSEAMQELGGGIIDFVAESCKSFFEALDKQDVSESFKNTMQQLWEIFCGLVDAISACLETIGRWLEEASRSEIVRDLMDAVAELCGAILDLIGAFMELCSTALSEFFEGIGKTQPVFSFRDAVKAVVKMITAMIRGASKLVKGLTELFKMLSDNRTFKEFFRGLGEQAGIFFDIVMKALGAVGRLGQALMALVRGDWEDAKRLAGAAIDMLFGGGKAEAGGRNYKFGEKMPSGDLSAEHEGAVDSIGGDSTGGASYGSYQIAQNTMPSFIEWMRQYNSGYSDALSSAGSVGSLEFDAEWKRIARNDPEGFHRLQHDFIAETHYTDQVNALNKMGIDINNRSQTLREVLWSMAVQMRDYTPDIFKSALDGVNINDITDEELIPKLYEVRKRYFSQSTPGERQAVWDRYDYREMPMALDMLRQEREYEEQKKREQSLNGKNQFLNKAGEPPQYELRNAPEGMHNPEEKGAIEKFGESIMDIGGWAYKKLEGFGEYIMGETGDGKQASNLLGNIDPVTVKGLMGCNSMQYASSYNAGNITNLNYKIDVGGVNVANTNASPQEIGQAVADETLARLQGDVNQVASNRVFSGVTWT